MDYATYDHINEEVLGANKEEEEEDRSATPTGSSESSKPGHQRNTSLSKEFNQAYNTISASPWGVKFGTIFEQMKKQSEVYYDATKQEYASRSEQASKNWSTLKDQIVTRSRALSTGEEGKEGEEQKEGEESEKSEEKAGKGAEAGSGGESQAANLFARLRTEAMKGLSEVQKAEDAADAYLARMGSNLGNFLKDAVTISPPAEGEAPTTGRGNDKDLLFENKAGGGSGRVVHTTRLDAQLHLLHTNLDNFKSDPRSPRYAGEWSKLFSAEKMTDRIAKDLDQHPELRASMEKLVPDTVQYGEFWKRYYFLRAELDAEEQKRKELLKKAAQDDEEEVGWDEDESGEEEEDDDDDDDDDEDNEGEDDDDEEESEDDKAKPAKTATSKSSATKPSLKNSSDTLRASSAKGKPADVMSQPDSEASYDVVSGAPSGAPSHAGGSPPKAKPANDESDEEDWE